MTALIEIRQKYQQASATIYVRASDVVALSLSIESSSRAENGDEQYLYGRVHLLLRNGEVIVTPVSHEPLLWMSEIREQLDPATRTGYRDPG